MEQFQHLVHKTQHCGIKVALFKGVKFCFPCKNYPSIFAVQLSHPVSLYLYY